MHRSVGGGRPVPPSFSISKVLWNLIFRFIIALPTFEVISEQVNTVIFGCNIFLYSILIWISMVGYSFVKDRIKNKPKTS